MMNLDVLMAPYRPRHSGADLHVAELTLSSAWQPRHRADVLEVAVPEHHMPAPRHRALLGDERVSS